MLRVGAGVSQQREEKRGCDSTIRDQTQVTGRRKRPLNMPHHRQSFAPMTDTI